VLALPARRRESARDPYEKLFTSTPEGTPHEAYDKLAYNIRTRAFFEALRRGLINADELEKAEHDLAAWIYRY